MADQAQLLVLTHQPDLWRYVEIVGAAVIVMTAAVLLMRLSAVTRRQGAMILALAVSPILVFNQQVLTGHSLRCFTMNFMSSIMLCWPPLYFFSAHFGGGMLASIVQSQRPDLWRSPRLRPSGDM